MDVYNAGEALIRASRQRFIHETYVLVRNDVKQCGGCASIAGRVGRSASLESLALVDLSRFFGQFRRRFFLKKIKKLRIAQFGDDYAESMGSNNSKLGVAWDGHYQG
jgi:hypothetical protein